MRHCQIYYFIRWSYSKIFNTSIKQIKYIEIPYISDNRKINELYKAVSWYLSTNSLIDYAKETDLQYVYEKQIVPENSNYIKSNLSLNKIMGQNKIKEINVGVYCFKSKDLFEILKKVKLNPGKKEFYLFL